MPGKPANPFITSGYIGPDCFCNRTNETERLLKALSSKRHVTLISLRRTGKTGLLRHVEYLLKHGKNPPVVVYVDLLPTLNGNDLLNVLSSALLKVRQSEKGFFEKFLSLLSHLRPKLTYDQLTGQPSVSLTIDSPSEVQSGFMSLMHMITEIRKELIIMFDEFQQINVYPEKNIEHILRSIIQMHPSVPFVFSGSSKHMLEAMFSSAGRPFYQSSELMYLEKISGEDYGSFIVEKMQAGNKKLLPPVLPEIFKWTRLHTFYVQYVCNLLYEHDARVIDEQVLHNIFYTILNSYEPLYAGYTKLIPSHQYKLLQAMAAEDGISQPTSGDFISRHNLVSASSVNTSLKALTDKELIVHDGSKWLVYDVFYARWLEYHFKKN